MLSPVICEFIFWFSLAGLAYTFLGYLLLMRLLAGRRQARPFADLPGDPPSVSIILGVHNEEARIRQRLTNLLDTAWPANRLEVIVVSDGSTDDTEQLISAMGHLRVKLLIQPKRSGKPAALNAGIATSTADLLVFADARQEFEPDTIPHLLRHFTDEQVGAVSGALYVQNAGTTAGEGVDTYWRMERALREAEGRWDSCIGCTGAIYAIRRALYQPLPEDTLIDDVVIPMRIATQGHRVRFDPAARAFDPQTQEPARERIRKRRTLAGNYQLLFRHPGWLLPWRNRLWWQLISHKYLRLAGPFFLLLMFLSNAALLASPFYQVLFWGQCLFYVLAGLGQLAGSRRSRLLALPAGFVFLNGMALAGLWYYLTGSYRSGWEKPKG